jgi:hypothetical protein
MAASEIGGKGLEFEKNLYVKPQNDLKFSCDVWLEFDQNFEFCLTYLTDSTVLKN